MPSPKSKFLAFPIKILRSFNLYRRFPRQLLATLGLSLIFQFNIVLIVSCYTHALNISTQDISFWDLVAAVPVIYLTEMLPISINGIGVRDGAFVFFFERLGGTAAQGLSVSLLIIAIRYFMGLLGGSLLLRTIFKARSTTNDLISAPVKSVPEKGGSLTPDGRVR
jgi:uncharacterized membrane protein YbhN (UPF0104 family)